MERTFRKSVFSIKNFGLISSVYLCGIRKTITEPIRKPVAELQRPAPSRQYSYMKNCRAVITRSSPIQRTWLMEHINKTTAIMINDAETNEFHSRSVWMRNLIPTFKLVSFSLHNYDSGEASWRHTRTTEQPQVARFHVSTACMLLAGPYRLKMKALRSSKRRDVKLHATRRTATQQQNTQPSL